MFAKTTKQSGAAARLFCRTLAALGAVAATATAQAAAPGITGNTGASTFNLSAQTAMLTMPDGAGVYSWGYGCVSGSTATFAPATIPGTCSTMQVPGPTLIVTEGQVVTVTLTNNLPPQAGNTSILFPGFDVTTSCGTTGVQGLLTCEAAPNGGTVTYTFKAGTPGTRAYYSGTQSDLQVEMGLYGAVIVLPATASIPAACTAGLPATYPGNNAKARAAFGENDYRLAAAAFDHPDTCYDREYLFQFAEVDPSIHAQALAQVNDTARASACKTSLSSALCRLDVATEPWHPAYFLLNGRSMPDDMDPNYAPQYPNQPYNGNPHMHPGEVTLLRVIGQGRWQHPFHEHANHVHILARDGNMILAPSNIAYQNGASGPALAGPLLFTTTTSPGIAFDGLFTFNGHGLNWDMFGHHPGSTDPLAELPCVPDANGYNTVNYAAINYYEWCQDHNKPLLVAPFGDVGAGGPMTLPDPNTFVNGPWYSGSPFFGANATVRFVGPTGTTPPSGTVANAPGGEAGWAFMWHSHAERELTTNNIFPGGMLMMMLVDSREFQIDESQ